MYCCVYLPKRFEYVRSNRVYSEFATLIRADSESNGSASGTVLDPFVSKYHMRDSVAGTRVLLFSKVMENHDRSVTTICANIFQKYESMRMDVVINYRNEWNDSILNSEGEFSMLNPFTRKRIIRYGYLARQLDKIFNTTHNLRIENRRRWALNRSTPNVTTPQISSPSIITNEIPSSSPHDNDVVDEIHNKCTGAPVLSVNVVEYTTDTDGCVIIGDGDEQNNHTIDDNSNGGALTPVPEYVVNALCKHFHSSSSSHLDIDLKNLVIDYVLSATEYAASVDGQCVVCLSNRACVTYLPCKHFNLCYRCSKRCLSCPTCRCSPKVIIKRVYI